MSQVLEELSANLTRPLLRGSEAGGHEQPWRGRPGRALAVALPQNVSEVRSIVRWAREHRIGLLPQGAVTGLVGASTPPPDGPAPLVVSTDALRSRIEVREVEAVAVLDAGVRLSELNSAAAAHGLELPVDLAADPALGAMVATNTGGTRVLRHGAMSNHVLGVQAVIADAEVSVVGDLRGLRKDNTGPDPTRLLIGSAGSFGIITSVAVALSPIPADRATALIGPIADTATIGLLGELRCSLAEQLSVFEVMCPTAVRAGMSTMAGSPPIDPGHDPQVTVLVEASGPPSSADLLLQAVDAAGLSDTAVAVPPAVAWALRHGITEGLRHRGTVLGFDLCVRTPDLPALRSAMRELVALRQPSAELADFGHWGDGGVHANVVIPHGDALEPTTVDTLREAVSDLVTERFDGSWSAEHGIGPMNAHQWVHRTPPAVRAQIRSHKTAVDPLGILGHPGLPF